MNIHSDSSGIFCFESFKKFKHLVSFSTTRSGGYSSDAFGTFNLSYYAGDVPENVVKNRDYLCRQLGLNPNKLFVPFQTHASEVLCIDEDFLLHPEKQEDALLGKDALLTAWKGVSIAVTTADCVPIVLYAEDKQVIGAVHAGWRGTCLQILGKTVRIMTERYHCDPTHIHAAIGPCIGPSAFEVGNEVFKAFETAGFDMPSISFVHPETGKHHIDLPKANGQQLTAFNIPKNQIEISNRCTYTESDKFFSARKSGVRSGRMLTGICMV